MLCLVVNPPIILSGVKYLLSISFFFFQTGCHVYGGQFPVDCCGRDNQEQPACEDQGSMVAGQLVRHLANINRPIAQRDLQTVVSIFHQRMPRHR